MVALFCYLHSESRADTLLLTEENVGYRVDVVFQTQILFISVH